MSLVDFLINKFCKEELELGRQSLNNAIQKREEEIQNLENERKELQQTFKKEKEEMQEIYNRRLDNCTKFQMVLDGRAKELEEWEKQIEIREIEVFANDSGVFGDIQKVALRFSDSETYKGQIRLNIEKQTEMAKNEMAYECLSKHLFFDDSNSRVMKTSLRAWGSMAIRCFNSETGVIIDGITARSTKQSIQQKIEKSYRAINRLNKINNISISKDYLSLKLEQAFLVYEQVLKIKEEKEERRRERELLKEEEKLAQEIELEKMKIENERVKYQQELERLLNQQIENERVEELQTKMKELEEKEINLEERLKNRAGYVYIVSNPLMPSHLKIGVTRRIDPMERIRELSSASLAFKLDVHAIIFSEDAFALESKLHKHFNNQRINKLNPHKEWFDLPLDEVKNYVHSEIDETVEFLEVYNEEFEMSKVYCSYSMSEKPYKAT